MISRLIEQAREQATWDIPENTEILLLKMADVFTDPLDYCSRGERKA